MPSAVSALDGRSYSGFVEVAEAGLQGMITLRGDLAAPALAAAVQAATGTAVPGPRGIVRHDARAALWMSPDELLLLVPYAEAAATAARLTADLTGEHALAADVSDARAMFRIRGPKAAQVLQKLCPVDFATLAEGEVRRTRAAQVAAALWKSGPEEYSVVSFRSVAAYVMGLLESGARPGSELR
jgi:sarcosine oxidase subunit gamma